MNIGVAGPQLKVMMDLLWHPEVDPERSGFEGDVADESIRSQYLNKKVPVQYRRKGAANPVRYIEPTDTA